MNAQFAPRVPAEPSPIGQTNETRGPSSQEVSAESELQTGIVLTRQGRFREALPHLQAARGRVANEYAASFDLALCYLGTNQYKQSTEVLIGLRKAGHDSADVANLLAQAYIGSGRSREAFEAFERAVASTPENEKLYVMVADACMEHQDYNLALRVLDVALLHLPRSAKVHYQRGFFLAVLDQLDLAEQDFDIAIKLGPGSDIAYMAEAQKDFFEGNVPEAVRVSREAIRNGRDNYILWTVLGEALLRSGISPGQPEFSEAQAALEKSVAERPNFAGSQLALGKVYLMLHRPDDAVIHLELARQLNANNPAVLSNLANAYRQQGKLEKAQEVLALLAALNEAQAEKIRSAPGDRKASYAGPGKGHEATPTPQPH